MTFVAWNDFSTTIAVIITVCAALVTIYKAAQVVKELKKPYHDIEKRVEALEQDQESNHAELHDLKRASRLNLEAQMLIIGHILSGDHDDELLQASDKIRSYLFDKVEE